MTHTLTPDSTALLRKTYVAKVTEVSDDDRTEVSIITTDCVDRDLEVVVSKGLHFADHIPVLVNHDPNKAVGRNLWIRASNGTIRAKTQYANTPYAQETFQLVKDGVLIGKSIGMDQLTIKRRRIVPADYHKRMDWKTAQTIIEEAEVYEYSVATVPCNPDAVLQAYEKGLIRLTLSEFPELTRVTRVTRVAMPIKVRRIVRVARGRVAQRDVADVVKQQMRVHRGIL